VPIVWANQQRLAHASSVSARADEADTYSLQPRARLRLQDLPTELFQHCLDLLPTFKDRARVCPTCRASGELEWRKAPPRRAAEELSGLRLGDKGVHAVALAVETAIQQHVAVRELSLGENEIGDAGAKMIAGLILGRNSVIRRLSLRDNCIGDEGAKSLAEALVHNTSLEELDIWGNNFGDVGKLALLSTAKCKVFLELDQPCVPLTVMTSEEEMRQRTQAELFDWLGQVHNSGSTPAVLQSKSDPQDLLFRTFRLVSTFLAQNQGNRRLGDNKHQLIGVSCMLVVASLNGGVASEDVFQLAPWLAFVTDGACTEEEVREMAKDVRAALGYKVHQPTSYTFLRRYLRKTGWTEESFSLANYLVELASFDSEFCRFRPQAVAAAAVILSRQYMLQGISVHHVPSWRTTLLRCAHVDLYAELAPCAVAMARMHEREYGCRSRFVNRKYEWARLHAVAKIKPNPVPDAQFFMAYLSEDRLRREVC